jgi:hypothetical protein
LTTPDPVALKRPANSLRIDAEATSKRQRALTQLVQPARFLNLLIRQLPSVWSSRYALPFEMSEDRGAIDPEGSHQLLDGGAGLILLNEGHDLLGREPSLHLLEVRNAPDGWFDALSRVN